MNKFEARALPPLRYFIKAAITKVDSLRDTGESGDAYDAEAQTEAESFSDQASKP